MELNMEVKLKTLAKRNALFPCKWTRGIVHIGVMVGQDSILDILNWQLPLSMIEAFIYKSMT